MARVVVTRDGRADGENLARAAKRGPNGAPRVQDVPLVPSWWGPDDYCAVISAKAQHSAMVTTILYYSNSKP